MLSRKTLAGLVLLLLLPLLAVPVRAGSDLKITEMAVTTKMVKGSPVDSVESISCTSVKALYCFTRVESASGTDTEIKHIWYRDGEKVGEYSLPVKGNQWRTYSKKLIDKCRRGNWRVEAQDIDGNILKSRDFRMN